MTRSSAEGADIRKHIHTKVEIACAKCGAAYDMCEVLKHHKKDCANTEWIYVNVATKEVRCRKCDSTSFKIFEVIDKREEY